MELTKKLVISLLLLVLVVESRKHHHRRQHKLKLNSLSGERKQNVLLAPAPDTGYFKYNVNQGPMLNLNKAPKLSPQVEEFAKVKLFFWKICTQPAY